MDPIRKNYEEDKSYRHQSKSRRTRRARPPLTRARARAVRVLGRCAAEPQAAALAPDQLRAPRGSGGPPCVLPAGPVDRTRTKTTGALTELPHFPLPQGHALKPQRSAVGATLCRWVVSGYLCVASTRVVCTTATKSVTGFPVRHQKYVKPYTTTPFR